MEIDKSCKTCQYNFEDKGKRICANKYYGKEIKDFKSKRDCWSIGLEYWFELLEKLTDDERAILNGYIPSAQKREFKRLNVKNEDEYLIKIAESR